MRRFSSPCTQNLPDKEELADSQSQSRNRSQPMVASIRGTSSDLGCHCVSSETADSALEGLTVLRVPSDGPGFLGLDFGQPGSPRLNWRKAQD